MLSFLKNYFSSLLEPEDTGARQQQAQQQAFWLAHIMVSKFYIRSGNCQILLLSMKELHRERQNLLKLNGNADFDPLFLFRLPPRAHKAVYAPTITNYCLRQVFARPRARICI